MIRRVLFYSGLFLISIILQSTIFHYLKIGGVKPDLLLIIVVLSAVLNGRRTGAAVGFAFGLLEDLLVGKYIGLQALTKMLTGYIIGHLERKIFSDNVLVPIVVGGLGTVIHCVLQFAALLCVGAYNVFTPESLVSLTLASSFYNLCVALVIYEPLYRSNTRGFCKAV
ncbi:MAG TPA: rod shape-determining protein MreD [Clostridia bacterium]|nr:rod shape-determining protein MreD [Clostridia bacterium]